MSKELNISTTDTMIIAQEECAEVIQAISKIMRFGFDDKYKKLTNRQRLSEEVGDLLCMIDLLIDKGVVVRDHVEDARVQKIKKLKKWVMKEGDE